MDYLREGVHLRAFAQKDPLVEYRGEGHVMFEELSRATARRSRSRSSTSSVQVDEPALEPMQTLDGALHYEHETAAGSEVNQRPPEARRPRSPIRQTPRPPRRSRRPLR